ncbi:filamentous hemagglutinin N-terminal domain-containing protein [Arsenophonus nasoniae]|uniref:Filamentous hemagglutinin N-terminal domain-containing protein n=1 Tax=Arsenophonus nasoniae TaxID=638 RepID=D2U3I2_9GAMM|nr:filamentous hemagglutinin N-terminal domain-containing protein [Arsenophonus nasoniae]QBY41492.1 tRNA nuclease CdiA [Arsenophonus nasoniae]WGM05717.1 filamentous hemagglutinin N-terminal domain-containing protein [Arsenophonus nasoniae]WGM10728.1 filamentous hemagglutinin N-terminal domain-containing protein [Arsenophonus nasoniae]WGM15435.1 filamentous hemagglutinin N-terminal domain-containing protein [Arsenophonus nasoniae]CBA75902.1 haemagglutinin [Arsenophonus nasoniae]
MGKNKLGFIALSIASILSSFHTNASENIIIDNSKKRDLAVEIKNGVEHINIEKANEKGISHNYYQKFNVSEKGVVIHNPNYLTNSAAKFIINEVTSNEKSLLNGELRVNGNNAYLMVANPNGIECNGCSFSGTQQQLLVTGKIKLINNEESTTLPQGDTIEYKNGDLKINSLAGGKIVFSNSVKPVHDRGVLTLITNEIVFSDGNLEGKILKTIIGNNEIKFSPKNHNSYESYVEYNFAPNQQIPANYSLIRKGKDDKMDLYRVAAYPDYDHSVTGHLGQQKNSPYAGFVINEKASVKFDGLSITQTGDSRVINRGQLNAKRFYANVDNEIINVRDAKLMIGEKRNDKYENKNLHKSFIKSKLLKFDHASFNISNTEIKFDNNEFDSLNSEINLKNSIVNMNSKKFSNEDNYRKNDQHHIDAKHLYGFISLDNTKLVIKGNEVVNKAAVTGDGRLEINAVSYTGRKNIKIEGQKTTKIGQSTIKKNGVVNIKAKELLDTYGSKMAASNGLIIDTQQLKSKDGDIKIINKNIKPVVHLAELANENWKFADSKKIELRWKQLNRK